VTQQRGTRAFENTIAGHDVLYLATTPNWLHSQKALAGLIKMTLGYCHTLSASAGFPFAESASAESASED
jgi:hypothetical protein